MMNRQGFFPACYFTFYIFAFCLIPDKSSFRIYGREKPDSEAGVRDWLST